MRLVAFAVALCISGCCLTYGGPLAKPDTKPCAWLPQTPEEQAQADAAALAILGLGAAALAPTGGGAAGPTARCSDGTLSYAAHDQGACSYHGGVAQWLK